MKAKKLLATTLLTVFTFCYVTQEPQVTHLLATDNLYSKIKIFTSVVETISRAYIEQRTVDELLEAAIKGVTKTLDPHTVYLPADEFSDWNQSFEGYTGIGISFEIIRDDITVMSVVESSPAARQGIKPGDKIVEIDGQRMRGVQKDEASRRLMGPAGMPVRLMVASNGWRRTRKMELVRERIILDSVTHSLVLPGHIGYIKLEKFTGTTSRELEKALQQLAAQGMRSLILDLRGNGGGYLNSAIEVADKFIPGGHKILSTRGRLTSSQQDYYATDERTHPLRPMVVLIDHGSASAAEIVAGAVQDLDRALIVGKTSFGKGLVQSQYRFHDGSALLITTAKYYTPSGRQIQRDFFDKSKEEYYQDAYDDEAIKQNIGRSSGDEYRTAAGRVVRSGGGITPDIWVESIENRLSEKLREIYFADERYFYGFAEEYCLRDPNIKSNANRFIATFTPTDAIYYDFIAFLRKNGQEADLATLRKDREDIKFLIKREMAYLLWGHEARFRINFQRDQQLQVAISHLPKAAKLLSLARL